MNRVAIAVLLFAFLGAAACGDDEVDAHRDDGQTSGGRKVGQADLDSLLHAVLPFAQDQLSKHGTFIPFGAEVGRDGDVRLVAVAAGDPPLTPEEMVRDLVRGFRADAGARRIRSTAVCLDMRVTLPGQREKTDAVAVRLEHESGRAVVVYQPYHRGLLGKLKQGELLAVAGTAEVFSEE